jgi:hypothetical protein
MPRHTTLTIPPRTWVLLTDDNVTQARVQIVDGAADLLVQATVGAVAPSSTDGALLLAVGQRTGFGPPDTIATLFPGVTGANRLYGYSEGQVRASVSHA